RRLFAGRPRRRAVAIVRSGVERPDPLPRRLRALPDPRGGRVAAAAVHPRRSRSFRLRADALAVRSGLPGGLGPDARAQPRPVGALPPPARPPAMPRLGLSLLLIAATLGLSLVQVSLVSNRDIRLEAAIAVFDGRHTYMGDPGPSVEAARRLALDARARIYDAD